MDREKIDLGYGWSAVLETSYTEARRTYVLNISTRPDAEWRSHYTPTDLAAPSLAHLPAVFVAALQIAAKVLPDNLFAMYPAAKWGVDGIDCKSQSRQYASMRYPHEDYTAFEKRVREPVDLFISCLRTALAESSAVKAAAARKAYVTETPLALPELPVIAQAREIINTQLAKMGVIGALLQQPKEMVDVVSSADTRYDEYDAQVSALDDDRYDARPTTPQVTLEDLVLEFVDAVRRTLTERHVQTSLKLSTRDQLTQAAIKHLQGDNDTDVIVAARSPRSDALIIGPAGSYSNDSTTTHFHGQAGLYWEAVARLAGRLRKLNDDGFLP